MFTTNPSLTLPTFLSPPRFPLQVDYLLSGIFSRACKALGGSSEKVDQIAQEAGQLRQLLADKLLQVLVNLEGEGKLLT